MPITEKGLKLFRKAQIWYAVNGAVLMGVDGEQNEDFCREETLDGPLTHNGALLHDVPQNIIPLLAAIQAGFDTAFLAQVIEHHGISYEQIKGIGYLDNRQQPVFKSHSDKHVGSDKKIELIDILIHTMRAFDHLGQPIIPEFLHPYPLAAAMHTEVVASWPVSIVEHKARLKKNRQDAGYTRFGGFFSPNLISRVARLPNASAEDFLYRSGMLSKVAYRKEIKLHCLWEELFMKVAKGDAVAMHVLDFCKEASEPNKTIIRNAMTCMHPAGIASSEKVEIIWPTLRKALRHSDLADVADSVILMLNFSAPDEYIFQENNNRNTLLGRVCKEIMERDFDQIGFAHLAVFITVLEMTDVPQIVDAIVPEQLILKLDKAIDDMLGLRDETNQQIQEMLVGFQAAFGLLSLNHNWDIGLLNGCSSLGQKLLVESGANIRDFKGLSRIHKGQILESGLGL